METTPDQPLTQRDATLAPALAGPDVAIEVELQCERLGFTRPPSAVRLKFLRVGHRWTVLATSRGPPGRDITEWLQGFRPAQVLTLTEEGGRVLRAEFDAVPPPWERILNGFGARELNIEPDGRALLRLRGRWSDIDAFVTEASAGGPLVDALAPAHAPEILTRRQHDALLAAVRRGYYEIPRPVNLKELAKEIGTSPGSLSELLRRAEWRLVQSYVEARGGIPPEAGGPAAPA